MGRVRGGKCWESMIARSRDAKFWVKPVGFVLVLPVPAVTLVSSLAPGETQLPNFGAMRNFSSLATHGVFHPNY